MDTGKKSVTAVAIVAVIALVIGVWALVKPAAKPENGFRPPLGAQAGGLLLENYDGGYARQNGGLRTGLGISASSTLQVTGSTELYGATNLTGTTTPTQLLFSVGGTFSLSATNTVRTIHTNTTGPKVCYTDTFGLHMKGNGSFAPLTVVSVGTSTSAVASTNLIASSSISTSTADQIIDNVTLASGGGAFVLANNGVITAITGEIAGFYGSTTNLTNWSGEVRGLCSESSI